MPSLQGPSCVSPTRSEIVVQQPRMTTDPINPAPAHWNALRPVSDPQQYVSVSVSRTAAPCARQTERERCPASPGAPVIWFNISIMLRPTRLLLLLLPISTAPSSTTVQDQPGAQAILHSLILQVDTKRYHYHTAFPTAFQTSKSWKYSEDVISYLKTKHPVPDRSSVRLPVVARAEHTTFLAPLCTSS